MSKQSLGFTILLIALLASGCAHYRERQALQAREVEMETAIKDNSVCESQGHMFPSKDYTRCRRLLQEKRERAAWEKLQTIDRSQSSGTNPFYQEQAERYRPTAQRGNFKCEQANFAGKDYVRCHVEDREPDGE
ncbi:MAG: hypothetical protein PVJ40_09450 [Gammaproteobacteria bacterium]|jgi:hypothetical protein